LKKGPSNSQQICVEHSKAVFFLQMLVPRVVSLLQKHNATVFKSQLRVLRIMLLGYLAEITYIILIMMWKYS